MMRILRLMYFFIYLCIIGCSNSENSQGGTQGVTILNKGTVTPNQISTTIRIEAGKIVRMDLQSGQIIGEWSKQIQFSDYSSVKSVVNKYNLVDQPTITLAADQQSCSGWSGMSITIQNEQNVHAFDISGLLCDRNMWPEGPRELVNLQDNLVTKYFCSNPASISGNRNSSGPGYIIFFNPGVNAQSESTRLATAYGFKVLAVYDAIGGFYADFSTTVLEQLRCEAGIKDIGFNAVATTN